MDVSETVTLLNPPIEAVPHDERPPDVGSVPALAGVGNWPARPLSHLQGSRVAGFQVVFAQSALDGIHLHGQSAPDIEVCGVLVGHGCRDDAGEPYLLIKTVIRGSAAASRTTNVTFTADTWLHIQTVMDQHHPGETIVGWYHTHPGFGIFLSDMDVFICQHFFNLAWQCAFVYDPQSGEEGNFLWQEGVPSRKGILIEDDVTPQAARIPLIAKQDALAATSMLAAVDPEAVLELRQRVETLEKRQRLLATALAFVAAFGVMWAVLFSPTPAATPTPPTTASANAAAPHPTTKPHPRPTAPGELYLSPNRDLPEVIRPS